MLRGDALKAEQRAIALRRGANLPPSGWIDPLDIIDRMPGVTFVESFSCLGIRCPNLEKEMSAFAYPLTPDCCFIVQNDTHHPTRRRASVMEEIAHLYLGHPPTTVSLTPSSSHAHRTHTSRMELEARDLGSATLVPYIELHALLLEQSRSFWDASAYYEVSEKLIEFRAKRTLLWRQLKGRGQLDAARTSVRF